jgi:hypothetical protein
VQPWLSTAQACAGENTLSESPDAIQRSWRHVAIAKVGEQPSYKGAECGFQVEVHIFAVASMQLPQRQTVCVAERYLLVVAVLQMSSTIRALTTHALASNAQLAPAVSSPHLALAIHAAASTALPGPGVNAKVGAAVCIAVAPVVRAYACIPDKRRIPC